MNARSDGKPQFRIRKYPYGVSYRQHVRPSRPWIVKFRRNKRDVYIGVFATLDQATEAANQYLKQEWRGATPNKEPK